MKKLFFFDTTEKPFYLSSFVRIMFKLREVYKYFESSRSDGNKYLYIEPSSKMYFFKDEKLKAKEISSLEELNS